MLHTPTVDASPYGALVVRLIKEFAGQHEALTVVRCVDAARHGAYEILGDSTPEMVEKIARQHLHILALAHSRR